MGGAENLTAFDFDFWVQEDVSTPHIPSTFNYAHTPLSYQGFN